MEKWRSFPTKSFFEKIQLQRGIMTTILIYNGLKIRNPITSIHSIDVISAYQVNKLRRTIALKKDRILGINLRRIRQSNLVRLAKTSFQGLCSAVDHQKPLMMIIDYYVLYYNKNTVQFTMIKLRHLLNSCQIFFHS